MSRLVKTYRVYERTRSGEELNVYKGSDVNKARSEYATTLDVLMSYDSTLKRFSDISHVVFEEVYVQPGLKKTMIEEIYVL